MDSFVPGDGLHALFDLASRAPVACVAFFGVAAAVIYFASNRTDRPDDPFVPVPNDQLQKPEKWPEGEPLPSYKWDSVNLADYDGRRANKPLLICARGMIFDVSSRRDMYGPGEGCERPPVDTCNCKLFLLFLLARLPQTMCFAGEIPAARSPKCRQR